jgi:transcriptional regulator with XRE-family HTH domain
MNQVLFRSDLNYSQLYEYVLQLKYICYICEEMRERLKQFMDYKMLNAAELADQIGVQRSSVSHVINGRNNPSSSFIEKLLLNYPDLNARWLITGEGKMLQSDKDIQPVRPESPAAIQATLPLNKESTCQAMAIRTKKIDRLIILYDDKSFGDYHQEK